MRNKEALNVDFASVIDPSFAEEIDIVQMAAHDIRHSEKNTIVLPAAFTTNKKPVVFTFKPITRPGTPDEVMGLVGDGTVNDVEYVGMTVGEVGE